MNHGSGDSSLPTISTLQEALLLMFKTYPNKAISNQEIENFVIQELSISIVAQQIPREKSRTELQYRLAWARTKAKGAGLIVRDGAKSWRSSQ